MKDYLLLSVVVIASIIWFYVKHKKLTPYAIFGILLVIIINLKESFLPWDKKLGLATILSSLVGMYDLTYMQKIKKAWRYLIFPLFTGVCLLFGWLCYNPQ